MFARIVLVSCAFAVLVRNVYGKCFLRNSYNVGSCGDGFAYNEYPLPSPWLGGACGGSFESGVVRASDGGGFAMKSASPVPPSGVSVLSENEYVGRGSLAVAGQVHFLDTAYLEGAVRFAGDGAVTYGCGYGEVAIVSEEGAALGTFGDASFARFPAAAAPWTAGACSCGRGI